MTTHILAKLNITSSMQLPYFIEKVPAGFPSPAAGYVEARIDLNELCISHPNATFLVRVSGLSMINAGIYPEDILIVDRSLEAQHHDIIVCALDGEFTVKELCLEPMPKLVAYNADFDNILIKDDTDFEVFGVVINIIRQIKRGRGQNSRRHNF